MGGRTSGDARTPGGEAGSGTTDEQVDELGRIAASVRQVLAARAAWVSRVVDDEWLEVVSVSGTSSPDAVPGRTWRRAELDRLLASADRRGRLHVTTGGSVSYVQVPEDEPAVVDVHRGLLIAPLELADGELIGVLSTEGPVDIRHLAPGVCELVELYAEQVRLALRHSRVQGQLVAQLQEARELRELDEYRRDLLASITHDLKTPITAITLNTELLEADRRFADAGASPVAAIRRSTERLGDLVDDLLALARAEEGPGGRTASEVDLVEVVEQACAHSELLADERGVTFALDSPDALVVAVDGDALGRAFVNVVGNAVKYSLPDGQVRLRLRRLDDHVELTCADDGIGISEEDLPWIFEMFRRSGDAEARDIPGSGFGLAISQRIVTRLGGSIEVDSAPDQGSTFVIRVPVG